MELKTIYNYIEIALWSIIGLCFLVKAFKKSQWQNLQIITAIAFILFGISDAIEIYTGSLWEPLWLFALKAGCVITFFAAFIAYRRMRSRISKLVTGDKND